MSAGSRKTVSQNNKLPVKRIEDIMKFAVDGKHIRWIQLESVDQITSDVLFTEKCLIKGTEYKSTNKHLILSVVH